MRCSRFILHVMSDFYNDQIEGMVRLENELIFTCDYTVECLKTYLDALHGIKIDLVSLVTSLELLKFLRDLAKCKFLLTSCT